MPFDGKDSPLVAVPTVKPFDFDTATGDERLLELARWLDDEQAWRDSKMAWNFCVTFRLSNEYDPVPCGSAGCALGLARTVWLQWMQFWNEDENINGDFVAAKVVFGLTEREADALFTNAGYRAHWDDPEPKDVASAIRKFVGERLAKL